MKTWAGGVLGASWRQSVIRSALALVLLGALFWALPSRRPGEDSGHHTEHAPKLDPFEKAGVTELKEGQRGPALRLPLFTGGEATLDTWKDKLVVLNFWATWCTPCTTEMPALEALWREYRERGLVVVGVSVDRGAPRVLIEPYLRNLDLTFPILLDPQMEAANAWRVPGVPATFVIRPGGEVVGMAIGIREWNSKEMRALIESLLLNAHATARSKQAPARPAARVIGDRPPQRRRGVENHTLSIETIDYNLQAMKYVPRRAATGLRRLLRTVPAVLVFGPRQSGKSTLVRRLFPGWLHLDLERPRDLALVSADAEAFFTAHPRRVVIDEAQRLPELFPILRHVLDRAPAQGRAILTGSASPALLRTASETLAGRIGLIELTPFRRVELAGTRLAENRWFWGGFPPVHALAGHRARAEWLDSYLTTLLERDLPALGIRLPAVRLRHLAVMLTHVHGSLLNVSDLARSLGVSVPTVAHDLDVLEGMFLLRRLPPYHTNIQKRLTKSPKIYVRDTGLLHALAGLDRPEALESWHHRGHSFEGLVIEEVVALVRERVVRPEFFFWRTQAGAEIDLLIAEGRRLVPIEIKLGTVDQYTIRSLRQAMADLGCQKGWIVTGAGERRRAGPDLEIVPWGQVAAGEIDFGLGKSRRIRPA